MATDRNWHWWPKPSKQDAKQGVKGGFVRSPNRKVAKRLKARQASFDVLQPSDRQGRKRPGSNTK